MTSLRSRFHRPEIVVAPGCYDALSAHLIERAGFEAAYLSGASIAYTRFGRPDSGLVSMSEVADTLGAIAERVTIPLIVDADTGFGNALNVMRTVKLFANRGAAAIQLGHAIGARVIAVAPLVAVVALSMRMSPSSAALIPASPRSRSKPSPAMLPSPAFSGKRQSPSSAECVWVLRPR